jgi:hypothetical protein
VCVMRASRDARRDAWCGDWGGMADTREPETDSAPYIRLPWPLVALGLFVFLAALLAAGLFANRYLRPQVGIVPTSAAVAVPATITSGPPATTTAQLAATPAPTPLVLIPAATPTATAPPAADAPTTTAVPAVAASPSALPTVEPALADEVGRAYVQFWRVRSQALLELDPTHLADVMDGNYLANVAQRITELRAEGRAIKTQVVLNYSVAEAGAESASVVDDFTDNSIYVKIGTEEALTSPTADELSVLYRLKRFSGTWKVVDSARSR